MRVEIFAKDGTGALSSASRLVALGAARLNLPQKSKTDEPLAVLRALQQSALPTEVLREFVPHYSLKYNYGGSPDAALASFEAFCAEAASLPVPPRQLLLISGARWALRRTRPPLPMRRASAAHARGRLGQPCLRHDQVPARAPPTGRRRTTDRRRMPPTSHMGHSGGSGGASPMRGT